MNQFADVSQMSHDDSSSSLSHVSYDSNYPNAEYTAVEEEERAKRREEDKKKRLGDFQRKVKENANKTLKNKQAAKEKAEYDKQAKDHERVIKAKECAKKQRDIVAGKNKKGKAEVFEYSQEDPAGAHTNFHSQFSGGAQNRDIASEVIPEQSEIDESHQLSKIIEPEKQLTSPINLAEIYKRIDQEELDKIGVTNKQEINQNALVELHQYSMLQRFRQNKDFK